MKNKKLFNKDLIPKPDPKYKTIINELYKSWENKNIRAYMLSDRGDQITIKLNENATPELVEAFQDYLLGNYRNWKLVYAKDDNLILQKKRIRL